MGKTRTLRDIKGINGYRRVSYGDENSRDYVTVQRDALMDLFWRYWTSVKARKINWEL